MKLWSWGCVSGVLFDGDCVRVVLRLYLTCSEVVIWLCCGEAVVRLWLECVWRFNGAVLRGMSWGTYR